MMVVWICFGCGGPSSAAQTHGSPTARPGRVLTMHGSRETPLPAPGSSRCCVLPSRGWLGRPASAIRAAVYVVVLMVCTDLVLRRPRGRLPSGSRVVEFFNSDADSGRWGQCTAKLKQSRGETIPCGRGVPVLVVWWFCQFERGERVLRACNRCILLRIMFVNSCA